MGELVIDQVTELLIAQHPIPALVTFTRQRIKRQSFEWTTHHDIVATFLTQDVIQCTLDIIANTTHIERHGIRGVDGVLKLTGAVLLTGQYRERCDILPHKTIADRRKLFTHTVTHHDHTLALKFVQVGLAGG